MLSIGAFTVIQGIIRPQTTLQINLEAEGFKTGPDYRGWHRERLKRHMLMKMDLGSWLSFEFAQRMSLIPGDKLTILLHVSHDDKRSNEAILFSG